ncbi:hypothetical protein [Rubinisphaera margarita]|uniref:hypothetical protein n=1 Tax=Rubinisphaera margarita TaxID=2909586 RepID=UPI001EE8AB9F|nr:hypothetical protein [Rubinisphaera margarita]MCG6158132.1 hypothetical protein [Rubinisphaera margarita]
MERHTTESEAVDGHVGEYLDGLTQRVDASRLVQRVTAQIPNRPESALATSRRRRSRTMFASCVSAAALLVAFLCGRFLAPWPVEAASVLRHVHSAHSGPVDRCYRVLFAPSPGYWNGRNPLRGPSDTTLWTRGDRFWAEATLGKIKLVYGRDETGKLWVSPDRTTGIHLADQSESLPEDIAMYCAINSMSMPTLVEHVLADFELRADRIPAPGRDEPQVGSDNSLIWASLKPGHTHPLISSALLEVGENNTLVRLVLWTVDDDQSRGTVTFTLVETAHQDDEQYNLSWHLDEGAEVRIHQFEPPLEPGRTDR